MKDMAVLVTTRGRPEGFSRLYRSWQEADTQVAEMVAVLDENDPTVSEYPRYKDVIYLIGPRRGHAQSLNDAASLFKNKYRILGQQGDDHYVRTSEWDKKILDATDKVGITYGNDLWQGPNLPTSVYITSNIVDRLDQYCPKTLWHLYVDNYWKALGEGAGCLTYLEDVIIEHLHPDAGKGVMDQTYHESIDTSIYSSDGALWAEYSNTHLLTDIDGVQELMI